MKPKHKCEQQKKQAAVRYYDETASGGGEIEKNGEHWNLCFLPDRGEFVHSDHFAVIRIEYCPFCGERLDS